MTPWRSPSRLRSDRCEVVPPDRRSLRAGRYSRHPVDRGFVRYMGHVGWAAVSFLALLLIHARGQLLPLGNGGFMASDLAMRARLLQGLR